MKKLLNILFLLTAVSLLMFVSCNQATDAVDEPDDDPVGKVYTFADLVLGDDGCDSGILDVAFQGKENVFELEVLDNEEWAPLRVNLSEYKDKTVKISVTMNMWIDTASKIMWQTNDSGYAVLAGGNDYEAGKWISFDGEKTVTLDDPNPWFFLDNAGLENDAKYYIADFVLTVTEVK